MPLPDLIEIVPLAKPVRAQITVPGSKSITNRALVLAALADGDVTLRGALWSEDTQVMVDCLRRLGFAVSVADDPDEVCNRTIVVRGRSGVIPKAGTPGEVLELFVGNAGTAARFLSAMVCLGSGAYRLSGVPRMHERPQAALFQALRELGYRIDSPNNKLPAVVHGGGRDAVERGPGARKCRVSIDDSSQFASALMLCAERGGWQIEVIGENAEESPYVAMTAEMMKVFPKRGGPFQIEPDASSGSYFWAADWVQWVMFRNDPNFQYEHNRIVVRNWPTSHWQIDSRNGYFSPTNTARDASRQRDLGDSIMTAITVAALNPSLGIATSGFDGDSLTRAKPIVFTDLGRLRIQETERVIALRDELRKCGVRVEERGDTLTIFPGFQIPEGQTVEIETYHDHRVAMCFAVLGLKVPGLRLRNPSCVKKTFPNFFQKLAAPPPHGLGVTILDGHTGRPLAGAELFAA